MPFDVIIPPKWAAMAAARSFEIDVPTGNNALVLDLFCDGSFKHGRAGIAVVVKFWLPRDATKQHSSKACFIRCGLFDDNHVVEAFSLAEGAHVALDQIKCIQDHSPIRSTDRIDVTFWSDSTVVLTALEARDYPPSLPKKMRHILDIIRLKTAELEQSSANVSILFRWCPGECIEPHAMADEKSKNVRISGGGSYSEALALFRGLPHSAIQSALRMRPRRPSPHHPPQVLNPAMRTVTEDPAVMKIFQQVAGSSGFFSMLNGMLECLPSDLRSSMQDAIREQEDANKQERYDKPAPSSPIQYRNLFAFIEIAASRLPADQQELVFATIGVQKKANAQRVQGEAAGEVYESAGNGEIDVTQESVVNGDPQVLEQLEALEKATDLDEPEVANGPMNPDLPEIHDGPKAFEEAKVYKDSMSLDEIQIHDELKAFEEVELYETEVPEEDEILAEHADLDQAIDQATIIDAPEGSEDLVPSGEPQASTHEPEAFQEPEFVEQARPNRVRAAWNWFGRRLRHL